MLHSCFHNDFPPFYTDHLSPEIFAPRIFTVLLVKSWTFFSDQRFIPTSSKELLSKIWLGGWEWFSKHNLKSDGELNWVPTRNIETENGFRFEWSNEEKHFWLTTISLHLSFCKTLYIMNNGVNRVCRDKQPRKWTGYGFAGMRHNSANANSPLGKVWLQSHQYVTDGLMDWLVLLTDQPTKWSIETRRSKLCRMDPHPHSVRVLDLPQARRRESALDIPSRWNNRERDGLKPCHRRTGWNHGQSSNVVF